MVDSPPDAQLATVFSALAAPTRLALLRALRTPRILAEIEVKPEGGSEGRNLARQTVRQHLNVLIDAGLVVDRPAERDRGATREFVLDHRTLYATVEATRGLARLRPNVETDAPTAPAPSGGGVTPRGPCLIVVKGLDEGAWFSLERSRSAWIIGRRMHADVPLDFDPYVSAENARISWDGEGHTIEDIPGSRNGASVNFVPVPPGSRHRLRHGDILGVGRTLLVYWGA